MAMPVFDKETDIPESIKSEYEEKDGKWVFKAPEDLSPNVARLTTALDKERTEREAAQKEAKRLQDEAATAAREAAARASGATEAELKAIREAEEAARKPILTENETLKAENRKLKLTDTTQALFLKHGGMSDRVDDAMLVIEKRTDLGDQGGIVYKDKDGNVTAMDAPKFFAALKTEKPWFFSASGGSGGGSESGVSGVDIPGASTDTQNVKRASVHGNF